MIKRAFWNLAVPGCNEHYFAHQVRKSGTISGGLREEATGAFPRGGEEAGLRSSSGAIRKTTHATGFGTASGMACAWRRACILSR